MTDANFDLVVIGAGPGGYVAAIRAAQLGMKVACIDRQFLGGTCLNVGCIPSKALLDSSHRYQDVREKLDTHGINIGAVQLDLGKMMARKDDVVKKLTGGVGLLFKKNKVVSIIGSATIASVETVVVTTATGKQTLQTRRILIATGSDPVELPGLKFDGQSVLSSTEALSLKEVPKKLIIIGGGYIGVEMGSVWLRLGAEVLVVEFTDRILPLMDKELGSLLQKSLEKHGMIFLFNSAALGAEVKNGKVAVTIKTGDQTSVVDCDKVLVCTGRKPVTDGLGLADVGVTIDKRGFVPVDSRYETNIKGIYAIGDVIGGMMLAHKAEEEGVACVERMAGKAGHVNYNVVPGVVYTHPELAQVGLTEDEAKSAGKQVKVGKFPLLANGRAKAMDDAEGWVKVVADAKTDRVLGVQILASHASDMIAEAVLAMEFHASAEDIARTMHAHPTLAESLKEAALAVDGRAIHF